MDIHENKLIAEIEALKAEYIKMSDNLIKDIQRQDKIMTRSDTRQQREYDELMALKIEIEETQREVVFTMGSIAERRSKETGQHVKRVAEYTYLFAKYSGLPEKECDMLRQASPMHDIGKVAIPDAVLNKPGRFNEEERLIMDTHAQLGYDMLRSSNRPLMKMASIVAYEHHEKWNGNGYPNKLAGEDIHIYGRITALADVFDALGSARVYKPAWDDEKIFKMFKEERAEHFDPKLIDIFFDNLDDFLHIRDTMKDVIVEN
jgi:putative two-component system response regulator